MATTKNAFFLTSFAQSTTIPAVPLFALTIFSLFSSIRHQIAVQMTHVLFAPITPFLEQFSPLRENNETASHRCSKGEGTLVKVQVIIA